MNAYDEIHEILHYHFESVDRQSIKVLKTNSSDYRKNYEEAMAILDIPWMTDLLNNQMTEAITPDQAETIVKYIKLQSLLEYDLKVMFYLYGLKDASAFHNIMK